MKPMVFLLIGSLMLTSGCKKNDNPEPDPVKPVDPVYVPPVFTNAQPQIMSQYEVSNKLSRQGHLLTKSVQEIDPYDKISSAFEVLTFLNNFGVHEKEMNAVFGKLNNLLTQDSLLQVSINNLADQLNFTKTLILNQLNNEVLMNYITDIQSHMSISNSQGLRYYGQAGANYQNHVPGYDSLYLVNTILPQANAFIQQTMSTPDLDNDINGLYLMMCPVIPLDTSCMMTFAQLLIGQFASHNLSPDSLSDLMNTYLLLESYFYTILNYQYQAATVKMNALRQADSLQAQSYFANNFTPVVLDECDMFLQASAYLMLSICDYRTQARWKENMAYAGLFMSPNTHIFSPLARAQFNVRLLNDLLGNSEEVIYGGIFTPRNYCTSEPEVGVGGMSAQPPWITQLAKSRNPYTLWSSGSLPSCSPDNLYQIRHYALSAGSGVSQTLNMTVTPTWPHTSQGSGYGNITTLWYNPRNPAETSPFPSDSCTLQFGSFCLSWEWGTLLSDYIPLGSGMDNRNLFCDFGSPLYCNWCGNGNNSQQLNAPLIAQWHTDSFKQDFENFQTNYNRTYGLNSAAYPSPFKYQFQAGVQPYSSGAVYVYDQVGVSIMVENCPPGGSVSLFTTYQCSISMAPYPTIKASEFRIGSMLADHHMDCGLNCATRPCYLSTGDAYTGGFNSGAGYAFGAPMPGYMGQLNPSFQYYYNIYQSSNITNLNVNILINAQEVFLGHTGF